MTPAHFPLDVRGEIDGEPVEGVISEDEHGRFWFSSDTQWVGGTQSNSRLAKVKFFTGDASGIHVYLRGSDFHKSGQQFICIDDMRIGSDEPDARFLSVTCTYQYAELASRYYCRHGAMRSPGEPIALPALEGAPAMQMVYVENKTMLTADAPVKLEDFETQLEAFRRLLTFAVQQPLAQLTMVARDQGGSEVQILARQSVRPTAVKRLDYRQFPIRLGNENTQNAINQWWEMTDRLRPLPQTVAGIIAQPGYVDADFFFLATVVERLGAEWTDAPAALTAEQFERLQEAVADLDLPADYKPSNFSTFDSKISAVTSLLPDEIWEVLGLDKESWMKSLKRHRNLVAHSSKQQGPHRKFTTGIPLRALRDATAAVVTLLFAQHMGVTGGALKFAAERQRYLRIMNYTFGTLKFTNSGLE